MAQSLDPHFQMHKQVSVEDFVLDLLIILAEQIIYFDSNLRCLRVCTMHTDKCWQVLDLLGNRSNLPITFYIVLTSRMRILQP